ncbi:MAG TPA: dTDP-4-dehydrorhamnose reductase [Candidatus Saccharimonadales bacterium]|nr:dTDP-4-dehydrorhamnose reductase [Candidatus Saccharimonadales bacterium]
MKVLITGASGQLGQELVDAFSSWETIPTNFHNLDITDKTAVSQNFESSLPSWIIHCAAWTDVEGCAKDPEKAMKINAEGTRNLALAAKKINAKLVYISTNEVFDGKKKEPYIETDAPNPLNPYAESKLVGEKFVQEILGEDGIIIRTSWVFGPKGRSNFPLKILKAAENNPELKVVDDEFATPTYAPDLAKAIFELVKKNTTGIFNLVNGGYCSRYDWAKEIINLSGIKKPLLRIHLADYSRLSNPPGYSVLSTQKAENLGVKLRSWKDATKEFLENI